ncbi:CoA transferase [Actinoplanes sp. NPDC051346]|uniref:CoA transferase n=1 Tax=Actinoplanes sp. NPDC051346 TaxID=3155048 RepID=UPI0034159E6F
MSTRDEADEAVDQAVYGLMAVHGRAAGRPTRIGVDFVSAATGVAAASGRLAATISKLRGRAVSRVHTARPSVALLTVSQYLAAGSAGDPDHVERYDRPGTPPPFTTRDGHRVELETLDPEPWRRFWTGLGLAPAVVDRGWRAFVPRYATASAPLPDELHIAIAALSLLELFTAATKTGVAVQPVRSHADRLGDGLDGPPWTVTATGGPATRRPAAHPGGLPLAGLTVLEAGRRIQGPLAAHLLGLLGASVTRIEPAGGDPLRGMPPMVGDCSARFLALNRGKQVVQANLRSASGRESVRELAAGADVFLHNWAPGKASELGLDSDDLIKINPGLVYAYASGWGARRGPDAPPGTDFTVQAYAGLGEHLRPAGHPAAGSLMTLLDVLGGLVCAQGVLAALVGRLRDGRGRRVDSSLLSSASLLQALQRSGHRPAQPVWGPLDVPVPTADGHLVVPSGTPPGLVDPTALRRLPTAQAVAGLRSDGISAVRVCPDPGELVRDPQVRPLLDIDGCAFVRSPWRFDP